MPRYFVFRHCNFLSIPTQIMDKKIGFIGAGQMAEALARGFIAKGVCKAKDVFATDPVQERKEVFRSFGTNPVDGNVEVGWLPPLPGTGRQLAPDALGAWLVETYQH